MKVVWLGIATLLMQVAAAQETFSASAALDWTETVRDGRLGFSGKVRDSAGALANRAAIAALA